MAERLAAGDLTVQVRPRSSADAFGTSFASMAARLNAIVAELRSAAETITASSSQMSASATELAVTAGEGAESIEEAIGRLSTLASSVRGTVDPQPRTWSARRSTALRTPQEGCSRHPGDHRVVARDRRAHVGHRVHRQPDQPARAQCGHRSGARRRAWSRLLGCRRRGALARRAGGHRRHARSRDLTVDQSGEGRALESRSSRSSRRAWPARRRSCRSSRRRRRSRRSTSARSSSR